MKIEKLKQGMMFKNYKELCIFLEMKIRNGKSKTLQLNELSRFVEFHKVGNKFIVDEVLKVPIDKVDNRKIDGKISNNNKYSEDIQALIISLLAGMENHTAYLPVNRLLYLMNMVNCNYSEARKNIPKLAELTEIPQNYCYDFFNTNSIQLRKKIEVALRGLRNRALIFWEQSVSVCALTQDIEVNDLGDLAVKPINKKETRNTYQREYREATREEKQLILRTEKEVLREMNATTLQYIFLTNRWNEFQKKVNLELLKKANIEYYYDTYKIIFNSDNINEAYLKQLSIDEKEKISNNLNKNICEMVNSYAKTINNRAIKKISSIDYNNDYKNPRDDMQASSSYIEHSEKLSSIVIDKKAKDIRKELNKSLTVKQMTMSDIIDNKELPF